MPDRTTDERLLAKAGSGDRAAFQELYERHRDHVFRFAYRLLGSVELAEDVTHDCFLGLIRKPENFNPDRASLRTYLLSAARNLSLKQFRNAGREVGLSELSEEPPISVRQQPLRQLLDGELAAKVQDAVLSLPALQREALVLFAYEGLSLNEIAEVVGADVGAVKARLFRARERLKTLLIPYLDSSREVVNLEKALK